MMYTKDEKLSDIESIVNVDSVTNNRVTNNKNNDMASYNAIITMLTIIVVICIFAGAIALLVFDILALKADSPQSINDKCPASAMWYYILVYLILSLVQVKVSKEDENGYGSMLLPMAMMIWGCVELWAVDCVDEINDTLLYKMTLIHVIISFVAVFISLIIITCSCITTMVKYSN